MMLGIPMPNASLDLTQEVEAALLGQVSEVADQVCDNMLVACERTAALAALLDTPLSKKEFSASAHRQGRP
jgi:hypothetical protein